MIDYSTLPVEIEPMQVQDIPVVLHIERQSFSAPWSERAYEYELRYNEMAHYFVARSKPGQLPAKTERGHRGARGWLQSLLRPAPPPPAEAQIVGYAGYWLMAGDAHISTIAVSPAFRGQSIGELILVAAMEDAMQRRASEATLEVRVSNIVAQDLYLKYGYDKVGTRKGYYTDNNEDAFIMTTPPLTSPEYQRKFNRLKEALFIKLRDSASSDWRGRAARSHGGSQYG
jgi:ribosomal-protein-alanine N-acetyltransferase